MRAAPGEWDDLRLAAKAADRATAAAKLRPAFEKRLRELGYGPRAIAHAFSSLTGPNTVAEALADLAQNARPERGRPLPLEFETVEHEPGLSVGHSLAVTDVERDGRGIRITYTIRPPLPRHAAPPHVEARDDCHREYRRLGEWCGLAGSEDRATHHTAGGFALPLPHEPASLLRVRMSWLGGFTALWDQPAHEVRIRL